MSAFRCDFCRDPVEPERDPDCLVTDVVTLCERCREALPETPAIDGGSPEMRS